MESQQSTEESSQQEDKLFNQADWKILAGRIYPPLGVAFCQNIHPWFQISKKINVLHTAHAWHWDSSLYRGGCTRRANKRRINCKGLGTSDTLYTVVKNPENNPQETPRILKESRKSPLSWILRNPIDSQRAPGDPNKSLWGRGKKRSPLRPFLTLALRVPTFF